MKVAIIGRTEVLYDTALRLQEEGHQVVCILTAREAPEYTRTADDFRQLATDWQIPFAQGARIKEHSDFLRDARADIGISVNYAGIIPQSVIDLFKLGVLNAHGGDLPRYRGNACQAWAILNGEERIGLCVHRMVGGELDSGDIVAREYLQINRTTKVTEVLNWITNRSPALFLQAIEALAKSPNFVLERQSTDPQHALRCYPRRPEDGRIDWHKPALDVLRLINASNKPYAGAFCDFEGEKLIIWDAEIVDDGEAFCASPGQVTRIAKGFIEVACGAGKLRCTKIEMSGEVCTADFKVTSIRKRLC